MKKTKPQYVLELSYAPQYGRKTKNYTNDQAQDAIRLWVKDKRQKATIQEVDGSNVKIALTYQPGQRTLNHLKSRLSNYVAVRSFKVIQ